ncbi:amidohydrolase [bacterium]|nr:amidohydrolase [bacterium]
MRLFCIVGLTALCATLLLPREGLSRNRADSYKQEAIVWIDGNREQFEKAAQSIHEFAETSLREHKSSDYLAGMLERDGFTVERGVADMPTAFVATFGSGHPVIGILAEYDALPGLSQVPGLPEKKPLRDGAPGHGCGHNLFGTGSAAAAMAMKAVMEKNNLKGTVKLFGCPAEETLIGKIYMMKAGVFDGLDVCLTWHPSSNSKASMAKTIALNNFEVIFRGKTAHGAADPWDGRSALDAVELMDTGVNFLREHVKPTVRIHYVIPDGGLAPNIVPDYAKVWYFVRDENRAGVEDVYKRVLKCAEGAALMTDTTMEVNLITGGYEYLPNKVLSKLLDENLRIVGPPQFTEEEQAFAKKMQKNLGVEEKGLSAEIEDFPEKETPGGGSTDVADISWNIPTSGELGIASMPPGIPGHSWAVASAVGCSVGYKGMIVAAKTLAASGIELIMDAKIVEQAQKEFREKTKDFTYKNALPPDQKPPVPED